MFTLDGHELKSKPTMDVLADTIETCKVPDDEKFELMTRIRTAQVLFPGMMKNARSLSLSVSSPQPSLFTPIPNPRRCHRFSFMSLT